jgi:transposase
MRCGPGQAVPGYNLQSAVDARHGLIVHHAVCCDVNDRRQLWPIAHRVRERLDRQTLTVAADSGYSNVAQLNACEAEGITAYLPIQRSTIGAPGLYPVQAFVYDARYDHYQCPQGQRLERKQVMSKDRLVIYATRSPSTCGQCPAKGQCTAGAQRYLSRHQDEAVYERTQARLADHPEMMALRRQTVEHPFGTIKERILGNARLLMRGLAGATAELNLAILVFNFRRVRNLLGTAGTLQAARTI